MDASGASCHARSTSLPSESHPLVACVEDQFRKLRSSEAVSFTKLDGLKGLYESVDDLLQIPLAQKAFSREQNVKSGQQVLDGSVRLLDICSTTKEVFSRVKCCMKHIELYFRRKNGGQSSQENDFKKYVISKKEVDRIVGKCLGNLKKTQLRNLAAGDKDANLEAIVIILREVEGVSVKTFESLLLSFCSPKAREKTTRVWSLLTKLIQSKHVLYNEDSHMEKVDEALIALSKQKLSESIHVIHVQKLQKDIQKLNTRMQQVEEGLDTLFRCLIKIRVSLLNILSH